MFFSLCKHGNASKMTFSSCKLGKRSKNVFLRYFCKHDVLFHFVNFKYVSKTFLKFCKVETRFKNVSFHFVKFETCFKTCFSLTELSHRITTKQPFLLILTFSEVKKLFSETSKCVIGKKLLGSNRRYMSYPIKFVFYLHRAYGY